MTPALAARAPLPRTATSEVALVNMPWAMLGAPSIQLSTVKALLAKHAIGAHVFNFPLEWAQYLVDRGFSVTDVKRVGGATRGLGEFVFAVAPFRATTDADDAAFARLFDEDEPDRQCFALAKRMREHVPGFLAQCVDRIAALGARIVGFTSTFQQNVPALALAQALKARVPETVIVFGGANCDGVMGDTLHREFPFVDVVVRGEAEAIAGPLFAELVAKKPLTRFPGICFRTDGERVVVPQGGPLPEMREVPTPDHDDYFRDVERTSFRGDLEPISIPFESARGCWWGQKHHCTFCGLNGTSMKFRSKTAARTFDEIMALAKRHKVTTFHATDNIIEMGYFEELLPELAKAGVDLSFFYETKANLKRSQMAAMAAAGVHEIQPGIESLDTSVLALMNKGTTALQNIRLLKWALEYRIQVSWNVIVGFPGEDPAAYARMAALVPSLVHFEPPHTSTLEVHRFSPYHASTERYPIRITGPRPFYKHVYPLDETTLRDIAYAFSFEYTEERDVESYVAPLVDAVRAWKNAWRRAKLELRRGPGFVTIEDTRGEAIGAPRATHRLEAVEAEIYGMLDASATPGAIAHELAKKAEHGEVVPNATDVEAFLKELVKLRLVYEEGGRYLSLAIPARPPR